MICACCSRGIHAMHSAPGCECMDPAHSDPLALAAYARRCVMEAVGNAAGWTTDRPGSDPEALRRDMASAPRLARSTDPDTSHIAAAAQRGKTKRESAIWHALHHMGAGGGTGYDIARACGLTQVQVMRSMSVLERKLWVKKTGLTKRGDSGYECTIYTSTNPDREIRLARQT
jgi:hypothetical protein